MATAAAGEQSSNVLIHPLLVINISEHYTRVAHQKGDRNVRVVGALLGTQQGRNIELMNSFEFPLESGEDGAPPTVDHGFFGERRDQYRQVFPTFDFLGWYTVGQEPSAEDIQIHQQLMTYNETPLLVQMHPAATTRSLPLSVFESVVELVDGEPQVAFSSAAYEVETGEAERIAVDHVAKPSTGANEGAQTGMITAITTQRNAVQTLADRVATIISYLQAVRTGTAPLDPETMRQISALVSRLSATDVEELKTEFDTEYDDVSLTTYLSTLTEQLNVANELVEKHMLLNAEQERATRRGGGPGDEFPAGMMRRQRRLADM